MFFSFLFSFVCAKHCFLYVVHPEIRLWSAVIDPGVDGSHTQSLFWCCPDQCLCAGCQSFLFQPLVEIPKLRPLSQFGGGSCHAGACLLMMVPAVLPHLVSADRGIHLAPCLQGTALICSLIFSLILSV